MSRGVTRAEHFCAALEDLDRVLALPDLTDEERADYQDVQAIAREELAQLEAVKPIGGAS